MLISLAATRFPVTVVKFNNFKTASENVYNMKTFYSNRFEVILEHKFKILLFLKSADSSCALSMYAEVLTRIQYTISYVLTFRCRSESNR